MRIDRIPCPANKNTFTIKPIRELLCEEMGSGFWIDPFANNSTFANVTNDLNPDYNTDYHLDAVEFLKIFGNESVDGVLYDPPFSYRQVSEVYKGFGYNVTSETTNASFYAKHKREIARILKVGGKVITCGWNSVGVGKSYGFNMTRVLLVPHGGHHNDTIVTVEQKIDPYEEDYAKHPLLFS